MGLVYFIDCDTFKECSFFWNNIACTTYLWELFFVLWAFLSMYCFVFFYNKQRTIISYMCYGTKWTLSTFKHLFIHCSAEVSDKNVCVKWSIILGHRDLSDNSTGGAPGMRDQHSHFDRWSSSYEWPGPTKISSNHTREAAMLYGLLHLVYSNQHILDWSHPLWWLPSSLQNHVSTSAHHFLQPITFFMWSLFYCRFGHFPISPKPSERLHTVLNLCELHFFFNLVNVFTNKCFRII